MLVAYMGQVDYIRLYLEFGAEVNLTAPKEETPRASAAVRSQTPAARLLLDAGADPNRHVHSGVSTDMFDGGVKLWRRLPLHYAAAYGDGEMIEAMLAAGADKAALNAHGETPIEYAGPSHHPRNLLILLRVA